MVEKTYRMPQQDWCWRWVQDRVGQLLLATALYFIIPGLNLAGLQYLRVDHFRKCHIPLFSMNLVEFIWASRNQGR